MQSFSTKWPSKIKFWSYLRRLRVVASFFIHKLDKWWLVSKTFNKNIISRIPKYFILSKHLVIRILLLSYYKLWPLWKRSTQINDPHIQPMYLEHTFPRRPFRFIHSMLTLGAWSWYKKTCEMKGRNYREIIIKIYQLTFRIIRSHLKQAQELWPNHQLQPIHQHPFKTPVNINTRG